MRSGTRLKLIGRTRVNRSSPTIGRRARPEAATNAFAPLAIAAKLSTTRLHDLRLTAATHLIAGGVDVRTTDGILGHATLSFYNPVVEGRRASGDRGPFERLDRVCRRAVKVAAR